MEPTSAQEELYHIQESTNEDGTVDVKIYDWKKKQNSAVVYFEMPDVTKNKERMIWPQKDTTDNKFVRLVNNCGYEIAAADQIVGETVKYDVDDDELFIPKDKTVIQKLFSIKDRFRWKDTDLAFTLFYPLLFVLIGDVVFESSLEIDSDEVRGLSLGSVLWNTLFVYVVLLL